MAPTVRRCRSLEPHLQQTLRSIKGRNKMRLYHIGLTVAGAMALTTTIAAQNPAPPQPSQAPTAQSQRTDQPARVTVEGCLMREADVPGRQPNVAERAGIAEDYILTSARTVMGSTLATGTYSSQPARPDDTPVGTSGTTPAAAMYEIEGIDDDRLKQFIGQRVQIEGTFENLDRAHAAPEKGTPADDLVELRGSTIKQVAGTCAAK
jgi:hypothetical protein